MIDSQPCLKARASLERIRSLKKDFDAAFETATNSGTREDFEKAQELKARLEDEVKNLTEQLSPLEAERLLDLRHQYDSQTALLKKTGLVESRKEIDHSGIEREVLFMRGINGKKYPMPSYREIAWRILGKKELFETKTDQGFTKLLLVPFGMSLEAMIKKFKAYLRSNKDRIPRFKTTEPSLNEKTPVIALNKYVRTDINGTMVYDPQEFSETHGGKTKSEILKEDGEKNNVFSGWRVLLLQTDEDGNGINRIPYRNKGSVRGTKSPRRDIEANTGLPRSFLEDQLAATTDPTSPYRGEHGMTLEEWVIAFMTHFEETNKLMDDYENRNDAIACLTGTFFSGDECVQHAHWSRKYRQAVLGYHNDFSFDYIGPRFAVRV